MAYDWEGPFPLRNSRFSLSRACGPLHQEPPKGQGSPASRCKLPPPEPAKAQQMGILPQRGKVLLLKQQQEAQEISEGAGSGPRGPLPADARFLSLSTGRMLCNLHPVTST